MAAAGRHQCRRVAVAVMLMTRLDTIWFSNRMRLTPATDWTLPKWFPYGKEKRGNRDQSWRGCCRRLHQPHGRWCCREHRASHWSPPFIIKAASSRLVQPCDSARLSKYLGYLGWWSTSRWTDTELVNVKQWTIGSTHQDSVNILVRRCVCSHSTLTTSNDHNNHSQLAPTDE